MRFLCNLLIIFLYLLNLTALQATDLDNNFSNQSVIGKNTYLKADIIKYNHNKQQIKALGNVRIVYDKYYLNADKLVYNLKNDILWSEGNVDISDDLGQKISAKEIILTKKFKLGIIEGLAYKFSDNSLLKAALAKRLDENRLSLEKVIYSPCQLKCNGLPLWQIRSDSSIAKFDQYQIFHKKVFFEVWGVPVIYLPYFFHPMPKSPAKSGLLVPSLDQGRIKLPIYFKLNPSYDLMLTPRLNFKNVILETEFRHKLSQGHYIINLNFTQLPIIIQNKLIHNRYFINSIGNFQSGQSNYGFAVNQTSDKAFIKEYYNIYDSYLYSKFYYNQLNRFDYISVESMYFKNLKVVDSSQKNQLILPKIRTKNIYDLDCISSELKIENNLLFYNDQSSNNLYQGASEFSLSRDFINDCGVLNSMTTRVRTDLYYFNNIQSYIEKDKRNNKNSAIIRFIPELESLFRLPLINESGIIIEPVLMIIVGRNSQKKDKKFQLIDAGSYILNDSNLFVANRYNGIDRHQFGQRINYGFNFATQINDNYYNFLFGQYYNLSEYDSNNKNYTGKVQVNFPKKISVSCQFTLNKKMKPKWSKISLNSQFKLIDVEISYLSLTNVEQKKIKHLLLVNDNSTQNKINQVADPMNRKYIQQLIFSINFKLNEEWSFSSETNIDLSKKSKTLYRNFKVTYLGECASIALKFYDDNLVDQDRNIKASKKAPTISLGLKTINF